MSDRNRFVDKGYKLYEDLKDIEIQAQYDKIIKLWEEFLKDNDGDLQINKDYFVHKRNLIEIIKRCDKRVLYFYIFHGLEEECEYKEVAILCFWLNTLKPFMVVNENSNIYNNPNELFSLYLILSTIRGVLCEKYPDKEFEFPSENRICDIVYDFKYCSLSREAMIAFVETLADNYGVGISYILNDK